MPIALTSTTEEEGEAAEEDDAMAAAKAVAKARAMAAAWTGGDIIPSTISEIAMEPRTPVPAGEGGDYGSRVEPAKEVTPASSYERSREAGTDGGGGTPPRQGSEDDLKKPVPPLVLSIPSQEDGWGLGQGDEGASSATTADVSVAGSAGRSDSSLGTATTAAGYSAGSGVSEKDRAPTEESMSKKGAAGGGQATPVRRRAPLGLGVETDPASHQHKRPVSVVSCFVSLGETRQFFFFFLLGIEMRSVVPVVASRARDLAWKVNVDEM